MEKAKTMPGGRLLNLELAVPSLNGRAHFKSCAPEVQCHKFDDGTVIAYDANSMAAVSLSLEMAKLTEEKGFRGFAGILGSKIAPVCDCFPGTVVQRIILNVSHACNLACEYCFAREYDMSAGMTAETGIKALSLLDPSGPVDIGFFGGEPLLEWPTMVEICDEAMRLGQERMVDVTDFQGRAVGKRPAGARFHVTTNGTLITPMIAAALKKYGFSVLFSLDGPEGVQNIQRPAKAGDSFALAMAGLKALNDVGIRPQARATFVGNVPLIERVAFFQSLFHKGQISGLALEPAVFSEGCAARTPGSNDVQDWHEVAAWIVKQVRAGKQVVPIFFFEKLLRRLLRCEFSYTECGAGKGYVTVSPDGGIYACHREPFTKIGSLETGYDLDAKASWADNTLTPHSDCMACWARYLCGGGCRQSRAELGGTVMSETPKLCDAKRALLKEVLWLASQLDPAQARAVAQIR